MTKTQPNEWQLAVLQWIADGCPEGVMTNTTYKVAAYALERRMLVKVKKRRPWNAIITEKGRQLLAGEQPDNDSPATSAAGDSLPSSSASEPSKEKKAAVAPKPIVKPKVKGATELMIEKLETEGSIEFNNSESGKYRQLANVAKRKKLFPDDMELVIDKSWHKPCSITLQRRPEWQLVELKPIEVPVTIRSPHTAVTRLKEQRPEHEGMDTLRWNWTLRIVQALALECEKRGYKIEATPAPNINPHRRYYDDPHKGQIKISIGEDNAELDFRQLRNTIPKVLPLADERRRANGQYVVTEESFKTDWIAIKLSGLDGEFWKSDWAETDKLRADTFLSRLLQEIELRAARAVEYRDLKKQREDEEQQRWQNIHDQAVAQLNEKHRADVLYDQAKRYQRAELLADYIAAMKVKARTMASVEAEAAEKWIYWAESHMLSINPLRNELRMPSDPKPDADAIKPFMQGLSPYGLRRSGYIG